MATIIQAPELGIDYTLYGDRSHIVADYLHTQMQTMPVYQGNPYHDRVMQSVQASYAYLTDSATRHMVATTMQQAGVDLGDTFINELVTFEQFQSANLTMQRWVMACPDVRNLYLQDNIDGYTDTYVNTSGKRVGEQDYHYQLAMSGVPVDNADGTETVRFYHAEDDLYPGDRKLDHHEKVSIQHTWRNARSLIYDMGFDFTNQSETPTRINFE